MKLLRFTRKHPVLSVVLIVVMVFVLNVIVNGLDRANRPGVEAQKWLPNESVRRWGRFSR